MSFGLTCYSNGSYEFPGIWKNCYHPTGIISLDIDCNDIVLNLMHFREVLF
jgi:hypothetical protein